MSRKRTIKFSPSRTVEVVKRTVQGGVTVFFYQDDVIVTITSAEDDAAAKKLAKHYAAISKAILEMVREKETL